MSPLTARELQTARVLSAIQSGEVRSQRALSREVGIALGLTNLIVRRVEARGWIRITRLGPNRARYRLTPQGAEAHEDLLRAQLHDGLVGYGAARTRILSRLAQLSREWPADQAARCGGAKAILLYGTSDAAEVAYACLHRTDLTLAGVIDDDADREFFGRPILPLTAAAAPTVKFGRIVIASLADASAIRQKFAELGCPSERLFWL